MWRLTMHVWLKGCICHRFCCWSSSYFTLLSIFHGVEALMKASLWARTFADTIASIRKGKINKARARIAPKFCQTGISIHRSNKPVNEELSCTFNTFKHSNFSYIFTFVHDDLSYHFISSIEVFITKSI